MSKKPGPQKEDIQIVSFLKRKFSIIIRDKQTHVWAHCDGSVMILAVIVA